MYVRIRAHACGCSNFIRDVYFEILFEGWREMNLIKNCLFPRGTFGISDKMKGTIVLKRWVRGSILIVIKISWDKLIIGRI